MTFVSDQNRRWWILAAMSGVLGLVVLDETVVGVALPTIRAELACRRSPRTGSSMPIC